jgi:hypothetical protein
MDPDSYPEGYLTYFSKKMGTLTEKVKTRANELYSSHNSRSLAPGENISSDVSIPQGLYREGDRVMWKGLPVPRVESFNGVDHYISLDKDKFINIVDSSMMSEAIDIINPLSSRSVGSRPISWDGKLNILNDSNHFPHYDAPLDSYVRNPQITNIFVGYPSLSSTSVSGDTLPTMSASAPISIKGKASQIDPFADDFGFDIPISPREIEIPSRDLNKTPTPADYSSIPEWSDMDNFS